MTSFVCDGFYFSSALAHALSSVEKSGFVFFCSVVEWGSFSVSTDLASRPCSRSWTPSQVPMCNSSSWVSVLQHYNDIHGYTPYASNYRSKKFLDQLDKLHIGTWPGVLSDKERLVPTGSCKSTRFYRRLFDAISVRSLVCGVQPTAWAVGWTPLVTIVQKVNRTKNLLTNLLNQLLVH